MKVLTISICLVVLSYGCSKDSPTSTELTTSTEPATSTEPTTSTELTLDTTTKEESGTYTILRWDGENWIYTADKLAVSLTWRFISHIEYDDGSVRIKGGYTLDFSNPSDNDVEFGLNKLVFRDKDDIPIHIPYQPIYEDNPFSRIKRNVRANSTDTYSDAFEIELDNIDIAEQIVIMDVWATVAVI